MRGARPAQPYGGRNLVKCPHLGFKPLCCCSSGKERAKVWGPGAVLPCLHPSRHERLLPDPLPMAGWQGMCQSTGDTIAIGTPRGREQLGDARHEVEP